MPGGFWIISGVSLMLLGYINPGSGGYLLQLLIAGGMALAFNLSQLPQKLARVWRRIFGKKTEPSDDITSDPIR